MLTSQMTPRIRETNMGGHISTTVVPVWFEAGRTEIYSIVRDSGNFKVFPLVTRTFTVIFRHVLEISGGVTIECQVARVGRTPFTLAECALHNGQACATGEVV